MNRTAFSLPEHSEYRTSGGLAISRAVEQFSGGANRLDDLIELLDRHRGAVLSSGTTVPGRYESFDLGFSDPPLQLETVGFDFSLQALNARGEVLIAFLGDVLREPCVVISERSATRLKASTPKRRGRDFPITLPANTRRPSKRRAQLSRAAICSRRCRGNCSPNPASVRRRKYSSGCAGSIRRP